MSLNKFDRDLDLLAELIHKTGHIEGDNTVIQFDHLIEISFETEGIGDSKIQHPWARGVSVPTIEEYEGQMSGEAVHVEFDRIFPLKFADIKQYRASFAQLDDETVKMLWDEALKGDQIDEDDSDPEPVEEDENNMKNETIDASKIKACPKCGAVNITFNHPSYDGGSYVSCCSCNYAPQEETWADSDWEALMRWNNLPKEEAPYNCEDTEETAKNEKTQKMSTKDLVNDLVKDKEPDLGQNNYLHVEIPEVKVKHGTVLRDDNGNSWIFLSDNLPTPEFRPLYRCCQKVEMEDENTFNITTTKVEEGVTDEKEEDEYTARDLMLITKNAIIEDLAKLKPVVKYIIAECIKHAAAQKSDCEVAVDLGTGMTAAEANKIEKILKNKGFRVHWKMGESRNFQGDRYVFCIDWGFPVTELEAHQ